ncbi:MAG TPA: hypothetical protein VEL28_10665 [Candidatus Binatia bacterium]|nr:hypothetical protein [Candidatus Binatia bacterium]
MRRTRPSLALRTLLVATLTLSMIAAPATRALAQCDADTEARIQFLETRLDEGQRHAKWWYRGWMAVFVLGVVAQSYRAAKEEDNGKRADLLLSVGKSGLGVLELTLDPTVARHGGDPIRAVPASDCARRLEVAEEIMQEAANQAGMRYSWRQHLASLGLNLGAAILVHAVWDEPATAWTSFGISEASAELHIWTHPTRQIRDWEEYQQRFRGAPAAELESELRLAAGPGGIGLVWSF